MREEPGRLPEIRDDEARIVRLEAMDSARLTVAAASPAAVVVLGAHSLGITFTQYAEIWYGARDEC